MQPPPQRKGKLVQQLRTIQSDQFSKLQQRYQLQIDVLEDVRSYMKQKCSIEREYAQSLQKLNSQYLQKRDYGVEDESTQGQRSPLKVWKSYLDESENLAKQRITIAERGHSDVADKIKGVKTSKMATFKKCQELFQRIYDELNSSLREMSKCRKAYIELEKLAEIAQKESGDAQDKLKKGGTFFKSRATLEKHASKSTERRDMCVRQVNAARNEYLLCIASLNGHVKRLKEVDLPYILKEVDGDFYEQMKDYNRTASLLEVEACSYAKAGFETVVCNSEMIHRDYGLADFLENNKVYQDITTYAFEPYGEDKVSTVITDSTVSLAVEKETRKLAMKYVKEQRILKKKFDKLEIARAKQNEESLPSTDAQQHPENNVEFLQEAIRKVETVIEKTEASLELLRSVGVEVDNWIKSAEAQMPLEEPASQPQTQQGTQNAGQNVDVYEAPATGQADTSVDDMWDEFDDTIYEREDDELSVGSGHVFSTPLHAVVLYDYTPVSADEISIVVNEEVEVLEKDGEGWCKGRNRDGQVGYFPESYVQISSSPPSTISGANSVPDNLSADFVEASTSDTKIICQARALFDYVGQNEEELSFEEGAIINILRKDDGEVDDGWWEGELSGQVGVFPSLLVEEEEGDGVEGNGGQDKGGATYAAPTNYYNQEDERTRNLYGTLPRHGGAAGARNLGTSGVCDNLDLSVAVGRGRAGTGRPSRPQLPQHLLEQNLERRYNYDHNEYV